MVAKKADMWGGEEDVPFDNDFPRYGGLRCVFVLGGGRYRRGMGGGKGGCGRGNVEERDSLEICDSVRSFRGCGERLQVLGGCEVVIRVGGVNIEGLYGAESAAHGIVLRRVRGAKRRVEGC